MCIQPSEVLPAVLACLFFSTFWNKLDSATDPGQSVCTKVWLEVGLRGHPWNTHQSALSGQFSSFSSCEAEYFQHATTQSLFGIGPGLLDMLGGFAVSFDKDDGWQRQKDWEMYSLSEDLSSCPVTVLSLSYVESPECTRTGWNPLVHLVFWSGFTFLSSESVTFKRC